MLLLDEIARVRVRRRARASRACRPRCPEQYASTCPRPEHAPWHGSPSSTITMWPSSVYARKSLPARHDAAADAGAESEREQVRRAPARAELELGVGGAAGVVLHLDRQPEALLHLVGEAHVADRDVDRAERSPCAWSMRDGMPKPSAATPSAAARARSTRARRATPPARSSRSGVQPSRAPSRPGRRPRQNLGPAEVDADHTRAWPWRR